MNHMKNAWSKTIPVINYVFLAISLGLLLGIDLPILMSSGGGELVGFWYMMLAVLAIFAIFLILENFVFRKKFMAIPGSDVGIIVIIVLRNIIFVLNFIPLIQLIGLAGIFYVGWILLILYIVFIISRFHSNDKSRSKLPPSPSAA